MSLRFPLFLCCSCTPFLFPLPFPRQSPNVRRHVATQWRTTTAATARTAAGTAAADAVSDHPHSATRDALQSKRSLLTRPPERLSGLAPPSSARLVTGEHTQSDALHALAQVSPAPIATLARRQRATLRSLAALWPSVVCLHCIASHRSLQHGPCSWSVHNHAQHSNQTTQSAEKQGEQEEGDWTEAEHAPATVTVELPSSFLLSHARILLCVCSFVLFAVCVSRIAGSNSQRCERGYIEAVVRHVRSGDGEQDPDGQGAEQAEGLRICGLRQQACRGDRHRHAAREVHLAWQHAPAHRAIQHKAARHRQVRPRPIQTLCFEPVQTHHGG